MAPIMRRLVIGEDVLASDGSRLGRLERLVVDEGAHVVTDLVVGGRVVPLRHFRDAGPDGLATDISAGRLKRFKAHDEAALDPPPEHWTPPDGYVLNQFLAAAGALLGSAPYQPPIEVDLTPGEAAHELITRSPVWAGSRQVGEVVEVLTDNAGETAGLVLERDGRRYKLPIDRVIEVVGPNVHADLTETDVELLEPYSEPGEV